MSREGRPFSTWLHFGLHFGAFFGAKIATILFFGRSSRQQGPQAGICFPRDAILASRGEPMDPHGGIHGSRQALGSARVTLSNDPGEDNRRGKRTNNDTTRLKTPRGRRIFLSPGTYSIESGPKFPAISTYGCSKPSNMRPKAAVKPLEAGFTRLTNKILQMLVF